MTRRVIRGEVTTTVAGTPVEDVVLTGIDQSSNNALQFVGLELDLASITGEIDDELAVLLCYKSPLTTNISKGNVIAKFQRNTWMTTSGMAVVDNRVYLDLQSMQAKVFQESFVVYVDSAAQTGTVAYRVIVDDAKATPDEKVAIINLSADA